MNKVTSVSFRIDTELKNKADALFESLGLNMTTAFNMFLRQSVREGRIPFDVTINIPNSDTISAMIEAIQLNNDSTITPYNVEDALKELKQ